MTAFKSGPKWTQALQRLGGQGQAEMPGTGYRDPERPVEIQLSLVPVNLLNAINTQTFSELIHKLINILYTCDYLA